MYKMKRKWGRTCVPRHSAGWVFRGAQLLCLCPARARSVGDGERPENIEILAKTFLLNHVDSESGAIGLVYYSRSLSGLRWRADRRCSSCCSRSSQTSPGTVQEGTGALPKGTRVQKACSPRVWLRSRPC